MNLRPQWALVTAVQLTERRPDLGPQATGTWTVLRVHQWYRSVDTAKRAAPRLVNRLRSMGRVGEAQAVEVWSRAAVEEWQARHAATFPVRTTATPTPR